eukprot:1770010-Lingulodinium_polyedra.AAC.1
MLREVSGKVEEALKDAAAKVAQTAAIDDLEHIVPLTALETNIAEVKKATTEDGVAKHVAMFQDSKA